MPGKDRFFVEVDADRRCEKERKEPSGVYLQKRYGDRILLVAAEGGGYGIRARVAAEVVASMVLNYARMGETPVAVASSVLRTFAGEEGGIRFTSVDIRASGDVRLLEFGHPACVILRGTEEWPVEREKRLVETDGNGRHEVFLAEFRAEAEDRIVFTSEGIVVSGFGTRRLPGGWRRQGVTDFVRACIAERAVVSAHTLSRRIVEQAEINELFAVRKEMHCFTVYFRKPRRILVCSGPPFDRGKDRSLAELVRDYPGETLVCGGTTAGIIARELDRKVDVILKADPSGLPPVSRMEGVTLVTEGVLTLNKVKGLLSATFGTDVAGPGTDADVCRLLLSHDVIEFVVGTCINPLHQDPTLPVELELRRNLVRELAALLENRFMKEVRLRFV